MMSGSTRVGAPVAPVGERSGTRVAAWLLVTSGAMFLATVGYLFTVLTGLGLELDLFDDAPALLVWSEQHLRPYQLLWVLYFLAQLALLPVPALLTGGRPRSWPGVVAGVLGSAAVVLAMIGLLVQLAAAPDLGRAFVTAGDPAAQASVLLVHDVTAAIGKELRLFSELLLGLWLVVVGLQLWSRHRTAGAIPLAVGGWTLLVAVWKIFDPLVGVEDWLGFVIGVGQLAWGVVLLRRPPDPTLCSPT